MVPPNANDSEAEILLRGVVRVENVENPAQYVVHALARCQERHVERTYGIKGWKDADDFLEMLARKSGRLLKGGEADHDGVAKAVLTDFLRGRIPWFIAPPAREGEVKKEDGEAAGAGKKRKRGVEDGEGGEKLHTVAGLDKIFVKAAENAAAAQEGDEEEDEESDFEGLGDLVVDPATLGDLDGSEVSENDDEEDDDEDDKDENEEEEEGDEEDNASQEEVDDEAAEEDIEAEGGGVSLLSITSSPEKNDRRARQQLQAEARVEVEQTPAKKRRTRR